MTIYVYMSTGHLRKTTSWIRIMHSSQFSESTVNRVLSTKFVRPPACSIETGRRPATGSERQPHAPAALSGRLATPARGLRVQMRPGLATRLWCPVTRAELSTEQVGPERAAATPDRAGAHGERHLSGHTRHAPDVLATVH